MTTVPPSEPSLPDDGTAGIHDRPPVNAIPALPKVPDHELLRCIGRGSYGEVWLARTVLGEYRAVKLVYRDRFEHERPYEREFEGIQKFEPISRLHDSQVDILHVGRNDAEGYFYYVMELADDANAEHETRNAESSAAGVSAIPRSAFRDPSSYSPHTLKLDLYRRNRLPMEECIQIGVALTTALEHLHSHGLVHRDVKPSNIIFVNGVPKLADIGLVASMDKTMSYVGTSGFLPPEGPGTPQGDLFSLGKVLYEISTGRDRQEFPKLPPDLLVAASRESAADIHFDERDSSKGKSGSLSRDAATALLELNAVILKACRRDPRQRYPDAEAMRADLDRLRCGGSVRRVHRIVHQWHLLQRVATWVTVSVAVLSLVLLASRVRPPSITPHVKKPSTNDVANSFYEQGDSYLDKLSGTNIQMAVYCFEQAIKADTNCARAYARLAETYSWSTGQWNPNWKDFPKARELALQALKLDDSLAQPHSTLGAYYALIEWNWSKATNDCRLAIQVEPLAHAGHHSYAEVLRMMGQPNKALEEITTAKALDRHSIVIKSRLPYYLADARHFEEAITAANDASAANLNLYAIKAECFCALKNYGAAIDAEIDGRLKDGEAGETIEELRKLKSAVKNNGPEAYWLRALERAKQANDFYAQGRADAQLGKNEEAMACLQRAFNDGNRWFTFHVMTDWMLDPLRSRTEFRKILKTMHLE